MCEDKLRNGLMYHSEILMCALFISIVRVETVVKQSLYRKILHVMNVQSRQMFKIWRKLFTQFIHNACYHYGTEMVEDSATRWIMHYSNVVTSNSIELSVGQTLRLSVIC